MNSVSCRTRCLILLLALTIGCNSKPSGSGEPAAATDAGKPGKGKIPVKRNVKTLEGNWVVVTTTQRTDNYIWLIKLLKDADGKFAAQFLDVRRELEDKPEIVGTEVDGDSVKISFKNANGTFDFVGSFQEGVIRGTIRSNPQEIFLTRLLATDETTLQHFNPTALPPGSDAFEAVLKNKEATHEELLNAAKENSSSPVAQDFFAMLMAGHVQASDETNVQQVINSYLSAAHMWGERYEARAELNVANILLSGRKFSQLALPHLDAALEKIGEDREPYAPMIDSLRDVANVNLRIQELASGSASEAQRTAAVAELTELLKKQPFNAEVLYALAKEAEKTGQTDSAMTYLSDLVALPMLEFYAIQSRAGQPPDTATPSEMLKTLWSKKNGNETDEAFSQFVDQIYRKRIGEYLAEIQQKEPAIPAADAGNQTVLVELFTGMQCPPCVAADLGLSAIAKSFPTSKVIVIRHHQHVPLPDGLVNQDSEERGTFYETGATPTVAVNGIVIDPRFYAGQIQAAANAYSVFRRVIDPLVVEKTDVKLEVSATVTDGLLNASVVATGISDDMLPSCRLRMAVVENDVRTVILNHPNGVRDHELLVREMLGGAKGIPPKKGELKYSITMKLAEIQEHAVEYIKQYETGRRIKFPDAMKPPITGKLSLVAWVQNDKVDETANIKAKMVLQSAIVPIQSVAETETKPPATEQPAAATTESAPKEADKPAAEQGGQPQTAATTPAEQTPPPPALPE